MSDAVDTVRKHLTEIPPAYDRLPEFIRVGSRPADPDRVTNSTSPKRAPLNLAVLDLLDQREKADAEPCRTDADLDRRAGARRQGVLPTLSQWTRLVDGELWDDGVTHARPGAVPCSGFVIVGGDLAGATSCSGDDRAHTAAASVVLECAFLLQHLDWIGAQKWVDEFEADLRKLLADMNYEMGITPARPLICSKCGWLVEPRDDGAWYVCTGCHWTWTMANEIDRLLAAQNDIANALPLPQIAAEVGRPVSTVKEWKARGWLLPVGKTKRGYVYDLAVAMAVAESVKVERGKRRIA